MSTTDTDTNADHNAGHDADNNNHDDNVALYADVFIKLATWATIVGGAVLSAAIVKMAGGHVPFLSEILFSVLMLAVGFRLGHSHFSRDIREIALYNLLFQSGLLALRQFDNLNLHVVPWLGPISGGFFMLFIGRIYWWARSEDRANFVGWPVFGVLGLSTQGEMVGALTNPSRVQKGLAYVSILLCFPVGYVLYQSGLRFLELSLFGVPVVVFCLVKNGVFDFFEVMSNRLRDVEQALINERAKNAWLKQVLRESAADDQEKLESMRGHIKYVTELAAKLARVVSYSQYRDHLQAETEDALDQAESQVDELLLAIEGKKMPPDVANLVAAYEQIKRDVRPDFIRLAQSIAHSHPIPTTVALHLVRSDNDPKKPD